MDLPTLENIKFNFQQTEDDCSQCVFADKQACNCDHCHRISCLNSCMQNDDSNNETEEADL